MPALLLQLLFAVSTSCGFVGAIIALRQFIFGHVVRPADLSEHFESFRCTGDGASDYVLIESLLTPMKRVIFVMSVAQVAVNVFSIYRTFGVVYTGAQDVYVGIVGWSDMILLHLYVVLHLNWATRKGAIAGCISCYAVLQSFSTMQFMSFLIPRELFNKSMNRRLSNLA